MSYRFVGMAGVAGTLLRYYIGLWVQQTIPQTPFPVGTLTVNLAGCFALGWFSWWALDRSGWDFWRETERRRRLF